jgi:hypothetical protein
MESQLRARLPWTSFKYGSAFVVLLWIIALAHTVLIGFGINTGVPNVHPSVTTTTVGTRRLIELPPKLTIYLTDNFSVRGLCTDELVADDRRIYRLNNFEPFACNLPSSVLIRDIDKNGPDVFVLSRESEIWKCGSSEAQMIAISNVGHIESFSIGQKNGNAEFYALIDGIIHFYIPRTSFDITQSESRWVPLLKFGRFASSGVSISVFGDHLHALDIQQQTLTQFNLHGIEESHRSILNNTWYWIRFSGNFVAGVNKEDNSRIVVNL